MSIIFFDIDGTIMDVNGSIPPSAAEAVRQLRQAGHHCIINTGRPRIAMEPQLLELAFDGLVCSCGQYIQLDGCCGTWALTGTPAGKSWRPGGGAWWICTLRRRRTSGWIRPTTT